MIEYEPLTELGLAAWGVAMSAGAWRIGPVGVTGLDMGEARARLALQLPGVDLAVADEFLGEIERGAMEGMRMKRESAASDAGDVPASSRDVPADASAGEPPDDGER